MPLIIVYLMNKETRGTGYQAGIGYYVCLRLYVLCCPV
jgi:hypothetical protein